MAGTNNTRTTGVGSAAWRKMFTNPLAKRKGDDEGFVRNAPLSDDSINAIIEGEIIPRLLMAHAVGNSAAAPVPDNEIDPSDASKFASLPLRLEAANLLEEVDNFLEQGVSVEAIFVDLLAPAARKLGEMWEADDCDFVDVTMGLWRLQEVMREISLKAPSELAKDHKIQSRALFAPMPGDQHEFGPLMLDEIFSRADWNSEVLVRPGRRELLDVLSQKSFDVVGLTLSRDCPSAALSNLIKAMRSVSANPHISVIIGGRLVNEDPTIVAEVGADGTGADARAALEVANRLVQSAPIRAHNMR